MSNEELIINSENAPELYNKLYMRNLKLIHKLCNSFYNRYELRAKQCGLEYDDLVQECYFAIPEAVKGYKKNGIGMKFVTFLRYPILNRLKGLFSLRTISGQKEPLNTSCSLNEPLPYDEELTLLDTVPDNNINIENDIVEQEFFKGVFPAAQATLNDVQYDVIRRHYKDNETLAQIAEAHNCSVNTARAYKMKAIRALRRDRRFTDYFKDAVYSSVSRSGLKYFVNNGMSCVEWAVMKIDDKFSDGSERADERLSNSKRSDAD